MENHYTYETDQFAISENAVHLLRNRFCFKTIELKNIQSIEIRQGSEFKNWLFILFIGLALLAFVVYDTFRIIDYYNTERIIYIERLLIPLFPFLLGLYSVLISFRKSMVMIVRANNKQFYFSLRRLTRQNSYEPFVQEVKRIFPPTRILG